MPNFSIALTGLEANSVALNTIGNNLANLNTTAYKQQTTTFADLYYQNIGNTGSNESLQVGTGTKVQSTSTNFTQGTANTTGNSTDVAIDGAGFFVVQNGNDQSLTRAGDFQLDATGNLITTDGLSVMGYAAKGGVVDSSSPLVALNVPTGTTQLPKSTTNVSFTENLNSTSNVGTAVTASENLYDSLGTAHEATVTFTKAAANTWNYSIALPGGDATGSSNTSGTLTFNSDGTLATPAANISGITFTGLSDSAADMNFSLNLYDANGSSTLTQTNAASANNAKSQDGYASGTYEGFTVDATGTITASYSNGKTDLLGQIAIATVANENGLTREGANNYKVSGSSGDAAIGISGTGGRGKFDGKSLESSNVDISTEFANLIVAQRAFEANSKTVTTFDTVTQDTIAMIR